MESLFVFLRSGLAVEKFIPLIKELQGIQLAYFHNLEAIVKAAELLMPDAFLVHEHDLDEFLPVFKSWSSSEPAGLILLASSSDTPVDVHPAELIHLDAGFTARDLQDALTARKKNNPPAQDPAKLWNSIIQHIPIALFWKDTALNFLGCNQTFCDYNGLKNPAFVAGLTDYDLFPKDVAEKNRKIDLEVLQSGVAHIGYAEKVVNFNGSVDTLRKSKIPLKNNAGEIIAILGLYEQITGQVEAQEHLKNEQHYLQLLMNNIPDRIYFKDAESRFIRVNKAFCLAKGVADCQEIIGKTDFDFNEQKTAEEIYKLEKRILETGEPLINNIEHKYRSDGSPYWLSSTKVPIRNENNEITGLVGISRDVTTQETTKRELQLAKEKAEEANKAKSMFLANMSHEIRTPMNGVIGMADILKRTTHLDDLQREYLDIIMKSGQTLIAIINDILDFSKIESGKLDLEYAPVHIREIVEEVADVQAIEAGAKGIDFLTFVDPDIPEYISGDYVRLKQVLTNLANNAVKFTAKGEVCVSAELIRSDCGEHDILFTVKDTGIGVPPEQQQKLFHSFTQVDSSTTRKFGGTGLGLAISQRLVKIMGGTIQLRSVPGQGASFSFALKLKETQGLNVHFPVRNIPLQEMSALVVDDNKTNRLIFRQYLESWGVKVIEAVDGFDALAKLQQLEDDQVHLDFALLDFQMAGMDGKELARQICQNPNYSGLRLILASSVTDAVTRTDLSTSDFSAYLNKPVKLEKLYQSIAIAMGSPCQIESERDATELLKAGFQHKRIMVVEDNLINMKVARHILKNFCSGLVMAANGKEAVDLFRTETFDYILMDIQMPVMNGIDATKQIREIEQIHQVQQPVRIIALTANALKEDVEACLQAGMDAFLGKPFDLNDLLEAIDPLRKKKG